jgi:hypothetical protein
LLLIGDAIDAARAAAKSPRGRKPKHHSAALLLMVVATAAAGSRESALRLLDQATWEAGIATLPEDRAVTFCTTPPRRDDVKYFRDQLAEVPGLLTLVQELFQQLSVRQARNHGNLLPAVEPTGSTPERRHTIYGDGTVVKSYSDVTVHQQPVTGATFTNGSRAQPGRARVQQVHSDLSEDKKTARGINFVALHTWTQYGRVTLATGTAMGAEVWTALELVEQVSALTGDGVHTLLYDRVFTGWLTEYLMAQHRIEVVNKAVARPTSEEVHNVTERAVAERAERILADHTYAPVTKEVVDHLRRQLKRGLLSELPGLPVGCSLYETSTNKEADLVSSKYSYLPIHRHDTPLGPCEHRLVVDDGGLYLIHHDDDLGCDVKSAALDCTDRTYHHDGTSWQRSSTWTVPCEHGDTTLILKWVPRATRFTAGDSRDRPASDAMTQLRPLHRGHAHFGATANLRNDSESYNAWVKRSLPNSRARTFIPVQQEIDFLAAAMLGNSITLQRSVITD